MNAQAHKSIRSNLAIHTHIEGGCLTLASGSGQILRERPRHLNSSRHRSGLRYSFGTSGADVK